MQKYACESFGDPAYTFTTEFRGFFLAIFTGLITSSALILFVLREAIGREYISVQQVKFHTGTFYPHSLVVFDIVLTQFYKLWPMAKIPAQNSFTRGKVQKFLHSLDHCVSICLDCSSWQRIEKINLSKAFSPKKSPRFRCLMSWGSLNPWMRCVTFTCTINRLSYFRC